MRQATSIFFASTLVLLFVSSAAAGPAILKNTGETIDLIYPEPSSVLDIYRSCAKAFDVQVLFDPKIRDVKVDLLLEQVGVEQAFDKIALAAGHFVHVVDERTVLIADDTPQNRRSYDKQAIQAFHLENIALKDAMTMLRSLIGLKHIAASEELQSVVIRDTEAKIEIAGKLLGIIDQQRAEVAVDVDLFYVEQKRLERLTQNSGTNRLSSAEFESLRRASRRLTSQELNVLDRDEGIWRLVDQLPVRPSAEELSFLDVGFQLRLRPQVHAASDEVSVELNLSLSDMGSTPPGSPSGPGPVIRKRDIESGARLASGESFLLAGLAVGGTGLEEGSWLGERFDLPTGSGEVVLALTPRIIRGPGYSESDLTAFCVGTEMVAELCDRDEKRSAVADR